MAELNPAFEKRVKVEHDFFEEAQAYRIALEAPGSRTLTWDFDKAVLKVFQKTFFKNAKELK